MLRRYSVRRRSGAGAGFSSWMDPSLVAHVTDSDAISRLAFGAI